MSDISYRNLFADGIWHNNVGFVQLLGLCPLLAVSNTVINALGLGLATMLTLAISNTAVSAVRGHLRKEIRIPVFVLIIASAVTTIELLMHAFWFDLYQVLGIFIPLIVTNCAIIGRAESFASRNRLMASIADGLATGLGFALVLISLGAVREILGFGSLFSRSDILFGEGVDLTLQFFPRSDGFLLAILPPGAFFALAALIALRNHIQRKHEQKLASAPMIVDVSRLQVDENQA